MTSTRSLLTLGALAGMTCLGAGCNEAGQPDSAAEHMTGHGGTILSAPRSQGDLPPRRQESPRSVDSRERDPAEQPDVLPEIAALRADLDRLARHVRALDGTVAALRAEAQAGGSEDVGPDEPPEVAEARAMDELSSALIDMDARFEQMPVDPATSQHAAGRIEDALYGMGLSSDFFIEGLSCRNRECRLDVVLEEGADPSVLDGLADEVTAASGRDAGTAFSLGTDATGARRMVIFLGDTGSRE